MRILFSARPAFGHVFPMVPLALAAKERGHDVTFASGERFLPKLRSWGFVAVEVGGAIEDAFPEAAAKYPHLLNPEQPGFGGALFVDVLGRRSFEDMRAALDDVRPDLLVYDATDVGAAVAAAAAGVPVVHHSLSLWIGPFRDALLERIPSLWELAGTSESVDVTVGDVYLDLWPPSMQSRDVRSATKRLRLLRPTPWGDPSSTVPEWIDSAAGPLVFVSLGTIFWGRDLLPKLIEALAKLDVDALVLAGVDATPEELPQTDRVRVAGFVDQPAILRRADAVVHHGGAGTLLGALANGVPAVVLPEGADRPYTGASLAASGAGISVNPREASADDIAAAVQTVLDDTRYRSRAQELKAEIESMPSAADVVADLESLV